MLQLTVYRYIGSVAQWLEQGTHKPKAVGSNPTRAICQLIDK